MITVWSGVFHPAVSSNEQTSIESVDSVEGTERVLHSWGSQSSLADIQRVPSYDSFDDEYSTVPLSLDKQGLSFKDYVQERNEPLEQGKPVIPAAVLAGFTGAWCISHFYSRLCIFFLHSVTLIKTLFLYRKWPYPAVAVSAGAPDRYNLSEYHQLDWRWLGVQTHWSWWGKRVSTNVFAYSNSLCLVIISQGDWTCFILKDILLFSKILC